MTTFIQFCRDQGVDCPIDMPVGRWVRCPTFAHPRKKNASVKLSEDGKAGWVHDWTSTADAVLWREDTEAKPKAIDYVEIERRKRQRAIEMEQATDAACKFYGSCQPFRTKHQYLEVKGLNAHGCNGLRVDRAGNLVVPMCIAGKMASVQTISPEGKKLFWLGAPTKGAAYAIGSRLAPLIIFAEGLATALTIFAAVSECRVIVAFNSGNLPETVFKPKFGIPIVAGDNDWETAARIGRNPGLDAARKAANKIGARIAIPDVTEGHSDFNDLFQERLEKRMTDRMLARFKHSDGKMRQLALSDVKMAILRG